MSGPNKYHDGEMKRWINRMFQAGWSMWLFVDESVMWCHADEPVYLSVAESQDLFKQFVNTGGNYIPTPYEVGEWRR